MENASKALIIAGAILLAIVIISLGLVVVNNTRSTVDNANLNSQEIETFNSKWTPYQKTSIDKGRVLSLIDSVRTSNYVETQAGSSKKIDLLFEKTVGSTTTKYSTEPTASVTTGYTGGKSIDDIATEVRTTSDTYEVKLTYNNALVNKISIKAK